MKTSEMLEKAKAVIADPSHWTQGWFAKDAAGRDTFSLRSDAVCWCSMGALNKAGFGPWGETFAIAFEAALVEIGYDGGIASYNDNHTHEEVMKVWDRAIQLAKEDEK